MHIKEEQTWNWFLVCIYSKRYNGKEKVNFWCDYDRGHLWANKLTVCSMPKKRACKLDFFTAVMKKGLGWRYFSHAGCNFCPYYAGKLHFNNGCYIKFCVNCFITWYSSNTGILRSGIRTSAIASPLVKSWKSLKEKSFCFFRSFSVLEVA